MRPRVLMQTMLTGLIAAGALAAWGLQWDRGQPNFGWFSDMVHGPAYKAFEPNPVFADGLTLQAPPAGTVPRGGMPLRYAAGEEEAKRAGIELANPFAADAPETIARGQMVFRQICLPCHGASGLGDGTVTRRGFPPPPSLLTEQVQDRPDGELFHVITYGQGNMAPHSALVARDDRWKVIAYLRSLAEEARAAEPDEQIQEDGPL